MGNYRFRLSDMMPNAWFYKLRDMSKSRNSQNPCHPTKKKLPSPTQNTRKSFYHTTDSLYTSPKNHKTFDTHFPYNDPPRKSSKKKRGKRKTVYMPTPRKQQQQQINPSLVFQDPDIPVWLKPGAVLNQDQDCSEDFLESPLSEIQFSDSFDAPYDSCSGKLSSSVADIIFDVDEMSYGAININSSAELNMISESELELPKIATKATKHNSQEESPNFTHSPVKSHTENNIRIKKNKRMTTSPGARKSVSRSGGVKIRSNGPKLASKKIENRGRKSVKCEKKGLFYSESFAVVKASFDPERDFRDSMMEMIVENNIRASKDLEDLLACYLSLNSNQYHDLIIKAFEQIWFNMPDESRF